MGPGSAVRHQSEKTRVNALLVPRRVRDTDGARPTAV